jgi:hypothetical protein
MRMRPAMWLDLVLIGTTLCAGIAGTLAKELKPPWPTALIILACGTAGFAMVKTFSDHEAKRHLENLVLAGLSLPNSVYDGVYREMLKAYGKDSIRNCRHSEEGMTCLFGPVEDEQSLVMSRYEVAKVYAAISTNDAKSILVDLAKTLYEPGKYSDDYKDKLGLLGFLTYLDVCRRFPAGYNYHDDWGVIVFSQDHKKEFVLKPEDIKAAKDAAGPIIFGQFEKKFRKMMSKDAC